MDSKLTPARPPRTHIIACATVMEEILPLVPPGVTSTTLEFGLHADSARLREKLQLTIDKLPPAIERVLLGYGLCSQGVTGLRAEGRTIIVPRLDDCIALFLGSAEEYIRQHRAAPGTLYLTKGWIEAGGSPLAEQGEMVRRFGEKKARHLFRQMIKNYTRLVFINTGPYALERYREHSRAAAAEFNLRFEEIKGSAAILHKLVNGPWDAQFVVAEPGQTVSFSAFR